MTSSEHLCSTSEAAALLGVSRQRVDALYRKNRLTGPPRADGSPILLYRSSVIARVGDAPADDKRKPDRHRQDNNLVDVLRQINSRLDYIERSILDAERRADAAHTTNIALEAVNDELRAAVTANTAALKHAAIALKKSQKATAALRRADQIRSGLSKGTHAPNFPPSG